MNQPPLFHYIQNIDVNATSTLVVAIATGALAYLTSKYVRITKLMLKEMQSTREPVVIADLEFPEARGRLVISNIGKSLAKNIIFRVRDNVPWKEQPLFKGIQSLQVIQNGISYLAPQRTLKYELGRLDYAILKLENKKTLQICIAFENEKGDAFHNECVIDVSQYSTVLMESFRNGLYDIAETMKAREMRSLSSPSRQNIRQILLDRFKKSCPSCGELISPTAKKCPHCHELVPRGESASEG
jgi:hypothetical protein